MDALNLLRAYHRALDDKRSVLSLRRAADRFWSAHPLTDNIAVPASRIYAEHCVRVFGEGSPTLCDEALQQAIKDLGNA